MYILRILQIYPYAWGAPPCNSSASILCIPKLSSKDLRCLRREADHLSDRLMNTICSVTVEVASAARGEYAGAIARKGPLDAVHLKRAILLLESRASAQHTVRHSRIIGLSPASLCTQCRGQRKLKNIAVAPDLLMSSMCLHPSCSMTTCNLSNLGILSSFLDVSVLEYLYY